LLTSSQVLSGKAHATLICSRVTELRPLGKFNVDQVNAPIGKELRSALKAALS
jgi:hypothetical protein